MHVVSFLATHISIHSCSTFSPARYFLFIPILSYYISSLFLLIILLFCFEIPYISPLSPHYPFFFFFNNPAPPEISPLSLPDALPICPRCGQTSGADSGTRSSPPHRSCRP